jgi:hypothetical protein
MMSDLVIGGINLPSAIAAAVPDLDSDTEDPDNPDVLMIKCTMWFGCQFSDSRHRCRNVALSFPPPIIISFPLLMFSYLHSGERTPSDQLETHMEVCDEIRRVRAVDMQV